MGFSMHIEAAVKIFIKRDMSTFFLNPGEEGGGMKYIFKLIKYIISHYFVFF